MVAYNRTNPIDELLKLYVRINAEIENDPAFEKDVFGSRNWRWDPEAVRIAVVGSRRWLEFQPHKFSVLAPIA